MTDKQTLLDLAERCERADAFDRELDEAIAVALGWKPFPRYGEDRWQNPETLMVQLLPAFTASLDATMSLVPEGAGWEVQVAGDAYANLFTPNAVDWERALAAASAATPALALAAAALRAIATTENQPRKEEDGREVEGYMGGDRG